MNVFIFSREGYIYAWGQLRSFVSTRIIRIGKPFNIKIDSIHHFEKMNTRGTYLFTDEEVPDMVCSLGDNNYNIVSKEEFENILTINQIIK